MMSLMLRAAVIMRNTKGTETTDGGSLRVARADAETRHGSDEELPSRRRRESGVMRTETSFNQYDSIWFQHKPKIAIVRDTRID